MKWVLGILALVVLVFAVVLLNAYKERYDVVRAGVMEAVTRLASAREEVDADFARTKSMPVPRDFPISSKYVRYLKLESGGRLVATMKFPDAPSADGKHVVYEPRIDGATLAWRCLSPDLEKKFLPANCR